MVAETTDTRRNAGEKQTEAVGLGGRSRNVRKQKVQSEKAALLSEHSFAEWSSFLDYMCKGDEVLAEILNSIFTSEPLQNLN